MELPPFSAELPPFFLSFFLPPKNRNGAKNAEKKSGEIQASLGYAGSFELLVRMTNSAGAPHTTNNSSNVVLRAGSVVVVVVVVVA